MRSDNHACVVILLQKRFSTPSIIFCWMVFYFVELPTASITKVKLLNGPRNLFYRTDRLFFEEVRLICSSKINHFMMTKYSNSRCYYVFSVWNPPKALNITCVLFIVLHKIKQHYNFRKWNISPNISPWENTIAELSHQQELYHLNKRILY